VVSIQRSRPLVAVAACAAAALAVTAVVAATEPTSSSIATVAALLLAPVGATVAALAATRLAGAWYGAAAAAIYALLPLLANRFMLPEYRSTFDRRALPGLVGLHSPWILALGIALTAAAALAPARVAAAAGIVGAAAALVVWGGSLGALPPALHESVWSVTFLEWLLAAGILGMVLRRWERGAAFGGLLVAAVAWAAHRGYDDGEFWRSLAVAMPSAAVCLCSPALLVPRFRPVSRRLEQPSES
jgi:hypothetical protein